MRQGSSKASILLGIYLSYVMFFALAPFAFRGDAGMSFTDLLAVRFEGMSSVRRVTAWDIWTNILLFLPFGFLLVRLPCIAPLSPSGVILLSTACAALLSAGIEAAQIFLPRHPSLVDIVCNVAGAVLGTGLGIIASRIGHGLHVCGQWRRPAGGSVSLVLAGYWAALCLLFSVPLPLVPDFSNWDPDLRLNLGNETALSLPWRGAFHGVALYDRALSQEEVLASFSAGPSGMRSSSRSRSMVVRYDFSEGSGVTIHDRAGSEVPVVLRIEDPSLVRWLSPSGLAILGSTGMSSPPGSARPALRRLSASGELSLESWMASLDSNQAGPNPFVSSSNRVDLRNFALAQDAGDLVFWLRTPLTGLNGRKMELRTTHRPLTTGVQHVVVTYASSVAALYLNGVMQGRLFLNNKLAPLDSIVDAVGPSYESGLRSLFLFPLGLLSYLALRAIKPAWMPFAVALAGAAGIEAVRALLLRSPADPSAVAISAGTVLVAGIAATRLFAADHHNASVSK